MYISLTSCQKCIPGQRTSTILSQTPRIGSSDHRPQYQLTRVRTEQSTDVTVRQTIRADIRGRHGIVPSLCRNKPINEKCYSQPLLNPSLVCIVELRRGQQDTLLYSLIPSELSHFIRLLENFLQIVSSDKYLQTVGEQYNNQRIDRNY